MELALKPSGAKIPLMASMFVTNVTKWINLVGERIACRGTGYRAFYAILTASCEAPTQNPNSWPDMNQYGGDNACTGD